MALKYRHPVRQDRLTCSRSRLCSLRRTSIFPMTSCSLLRSSSMSRCCRPSRSCRAGGNAWGGHCLSSFPAQGPSVRGLPRNCSSCCRIPSSRCCEVVRCEASTREDSVLKLQENFSICSMMPFRDLEDRQGISSQGQPGHPWVAAPGSTHTEYGR